MIGIIAATSKNGVIGLSDKNCLPFNYPEDLKHFRATTANSTVIMGRRTFESIGRPLPKRNNIIISSQKLEIDGVEVVDSIEKAVSLAQTLPHENIWFIGGASVYQEGLEYADTIILTLTPDMIYNPSAVKFPWINPDMFSVQKIIKLTDQLNVATYIKN